MLTVGQTLSGSEGRESLDVPAQRWFLLRLESWAQLPVMFCETLKEQERLRLHFILLFP